MHRLSGRVRERVPRARPGRMPRVSEQDSARVELDRLHFEIQGRNPSAQALGVGLSALGVVWLGTTFAAGAGLTTGMSTLRQGSPMGAVLSGDPLLLLVLGVWAALAALGLALALVGLAVVVRGERSTVLTLDSRGVSLDGELVFYEELARCQVVRNRLLIARDDGTEVWSSPGVDEELAWAAVAEIDARVPSREERETHRTRFAEARARLAALG